MRSGIGVNVRHTICLNLVVLLVAACGSAVDSRESGVPSSGATPGQLTSTPSDVNGVTNSTSSTPKQGSPTIPGSGNQGSAGPGSQGSNTTVQGPQPPAQTTPVAPTTTSPTQAFTPFACVARLISTLDRVPTGKRPIKLRVVATEGKPRLGWWRIRYGRDLLSGSLTFDASGSGETSTLLVDAGSTVIAEVFASSQYLPTSISCEAQTVVAP